MALLGLFLSVIVYHCKNPKIDSGYFSPIVLATHTNGEQFVGSESCKACHADIYASHIETAHYTTSAIGDTESIKGSFVPGSNVLDLESVTFTMRSDAKGFYQHTEIKNRNFEPPPARFDIVIGSGVRGQSYLTWQDSRLFQLQPSYHTSTDSWVNSPGYPSYGIERPVREACLRCHVTYAQTIDFSGQGNQFDKKQMMYGVDCERCHRPSAKHVSYHKNNPDDDTAKYMMKFDTLLRQQRLDACAQCHSGSAGQIVQGNSFSFLAGDTLDEYVQNNKESQDVPLDVHGNQYGLLIKSTCFQKTTMDCITCHDPHKNQRDTTEYFNQKCMGCHHKDSVSCKAEITDLNRMANNCIACHMPTTPSKTMTIQLGQDSLETSFNIRTHLIAIYSKETWQKN